MTEEFLSQPPLVTSQEKAPRPLSFPPPEKSQIGGVITGDVDVPYFSPDGRNWIGFPWVNLTLVDVLQNKIVLYFGKHAVTITGQRLDALADAIQVRGFRKISSSSPKAEFTSGVFIEFVKIGVPSEEENEDESE